MTMRAAGVARVVVLAGTAWLAGSACGWAQAAAEAGAVGAGKAAVNASAAKAVGKALGSVMSGVGAKVDATTQTTSPGASAGTTQVMPAGNPAERNGGQPGVDRVVGPAPEIHFDVVSFQRCAAAGSGEVELPADGDSVVSHCQPLAAMIRFAYGGGTAAGVSLSGDPAWVETELYSLDAKVAPEDVAVWQKMGLNARKAAVRRLLAHELKLKVRLAEAAQGKAPAEGLVVEHIERPLAD